RLLIAEMVLKPVGPVEFVAVELEKQVADFEFRLFGRRAAGDRLYLNAIALLRFFDFESKVRPRSGRRFERPAGRFQLGGDFDCFAVSEEVDLDRLAGSAPLDPFTK